MPRVADIALSTSISEDVPADPWDLMARARQQGSDHRDAAERRREAGERRRESAEAARIAAEDGRAAAETIRKDAVDHHTDHGGDIAAARSSAWKPSRSCGGRFAPSADPVVPEKN